jgi:hypothetical protein
MLGVVAAGGLLDWAVEDWVLHAFRWPGRLLEDGVERRRHGQPAQVGCRPELLRQAGRRARRPAPLRLPMFAFRLF